VFGERHRHPGEFIGLGIVGSGCGLELCWYLEPGNSIELEVEKIGILKNRVERQQAWAISSRASGLLSATRTARSVAVTLDRRKDVRPKSERRDEQKDSGERSHLF
jgi:hypothetical protein